MLVTQFDRILCCLCLLFSYVSLTLLDIDYLVDMHFTDGQIKFLFNAKKIMHRHCQCDEKNILNYKFNVCFNGINVEIYGQISIKNNC